MRYHNPEIREHLAGQYVLGALSPRVRRRTERLMRSDKALEKLVYQWQDRLCTMNDSAPEAKPPKRVWDELEMMLNRTPMQQTANPQKQLMQSLLLWRSVTAVLLASVIAIALLVSNPPALHPAGYVALMKNNPEQLEPSLMITAYQGKEPGTSSLHIQWNQRTEQQDLEGLTLWAIDRDTKNHLSLGSLAVVEDNRLLSRTEWQALKNSLELVATRGELFTDPIVFSGPCVQLSDWREKAS